jgi:hypothetical protein
MNKVISKKYTKEFGDKLADKLLTWIKIPNNFFLGSFAVQNKMHRKRFEIIKENSEKFADAYEQAQQIQEEKIALLAMQKKIDVTFAIFTLKNVAFWRDKQDVELSGESLKIQNIYNVIESVQRDFQKSGISPDVLVSTDGVHSR